MIVVLEFAEFPWQLRPFWFRGLWDGRRTYRFGWFGFSISFYRAEGLHKFFEHVKYTDWKQ